MKKVMPNMMTLLCLLLMSITSLYSKTGDVDNYAMALVANKMYTGSGQDGYIGYIHPLLCKIFEWTDWLIPSADCFTLVAMVMLLAAVWIISYVIAQMVKNDYELFGYYSVLLAVVVMGDLFHDNFTRWAAFLTAAGVLIILLIFRNHLNKKWAILIATLMIALGMMWRVESMLVYIPYVLFDGLVCVLFEYRDQGQKEKLVQVLKAIALPTLCVIILALSTYGVKHSEKYSDAIAYDQARSSVVDYTLKNWEEVSGLLPDMTENDYVCITRWILMDTERIDTQLYQNVHEVGRTSAYGTSLKDLVAIQKKALSVLVNSTHLLYLSILLAVLFVAVMFSKMKWYRKVETVFLYIGTDLILMFLAYAGRAIERGYIPAVYALLISVGVQFLADKEEGKQKLQQVMNKVIVVLAGVGIIYGVSQMSFTLEHSVFATNSDVEVEYVELGHENELYIWNARAYYKQFVVSFMDQGKLIPTEYMQQHICEGNWNYGQVYFEELLQEIDAANPMRALLERENTYYVAEDCSYVLTYLQEHFDENAQASQVEQINGIPVWQFQVK